jgi:hypothetical protein
MDALVSKLKTPVFKNSTVLILITLLNVTLKYIPNNSGANSSILPPTQLIWYYITVNIKKLQLEFAIYCTAFTFILFTTEKEEQRRKLTPTVMTASFKN